MNKCQKKVIDSDWLEQTRRKIREDKPLIHCITNPISINDCANVVLATGAKPIMAEHPLEVAHITEMAKSLAVNLGNITDARKESIIISGNVSHEKGIPSIIDAVGVTCSNLRRTLAIEYLTQCVPSVIKGNISEIKVLTGKGSDAIGIDVSERDTFSKDDETRLEQAIEMVEQFAKETGAVVTASGEVDLISNGTVTYLIYNGCNMMSEITGTGCMLNVLIGTYLSVCTPLEAALLGTVMLGVAGEMATQNKGTGTFRCSLLDHINTMTNQDLLQHMQVQVHNNK